jgi:hypothetical protein
MGESGELPPTEAALVQVTARLAAIDQTLREFQKVAWSLLALASRSPMHVERLEVERLEFKLDSIDVGELSGELNIGLTNRFNLGDGGQPEAAPAPGEAIAPSTAPPPIRTLWPPSPAQAGGDDGDISGTRSGARDEQPGPTSPASGRSDPDR